MGIMDNEGHDPMGFGNTRTQSDREFDWAAGRELERKDAEIARLREQLSHAVPAIEQLTKEREEYRTRWLASEVELRLALEALAHEQSSPKRAADCIAKIIDECSRGSGSMEREDWEELKANILRAIGSFEQIVQAKE